MKQVDHLGCQVNRGSRSGEVGAIWRGPPMQVSMDRQSPYPGPIHPDMESVIPGPFILSPCLFSGHAASRPRVGQYQVQYICLG